MDTKEKTLDFDIIELEMKDHIRKMKDDIEDMVKDMHDSIRKQTEEFQQDIAWDLKGFEKMGDPAHEFKTNVRELKKEFSSNITELQEELKETIEKLGDKVDTRLDILRDLSELELSMALEEIIQQAKNDELPKA